jgi:beta-glucuronidase
MPYVFHLRVRTLPLATAVCAMALLLCLPASAAGQAPNGLDAANLTIQDGPGGRWQMGGEWLFRRDTEDEGILRRFFRQTSRSGWSPVAIPHAWNATDELPASMAGDIVWYRKDFRLPSKASGLNWIVRFQNVRYHAQVWLNGREIGSHSGAYLPWEVLLSSLRKGLNRLVLRVDNRRFEGDLPPAQFADEEESPAGGWWNYGGLLGEAYLRRVNRIDMEEVVVRPTLPLGPGSPAFVDFRIKVRNYSRRPQRIRLSGTFGDRRVIFPLRRVAARGTAQLERRIEVASPRLWSPPNPQLYDVKLTASSGDAAIGRRKAGAIRRVGTYSLKSGIRSLQVRDGHLLLNGAPTNMRGVFIHEDDYTKGSALGNAEREKMINQARELGATMLRTHYPMHPQMHELADRLGVFIWSEIPVFQVPAELMRTQSLRRFALDMMRTNILTNQNHPSVLTWSVSNELRPEPNTYDRAYYRAAANLIHQLDPTRPASTVVAGYSDAECQPDSYGMFDLLGFNSYFGWYPGRAGSIADRELLSPWLDSIRGCYPRHALMVTEHGAEANRDGPPEERGTYGFQQDFYNFHNETYATKTWLSGVIGTLRAFRVRPGWAGGNPRPMTNWHEKGVIDFFDQPKPAYFDVQRWFRGTQQYGAVPGT